MQAAVLPPLSYSVVMIGSAGLDWHCVKTRPLFVVNHPPVWQGYHAASCLSHLNTDGSFWLISVCCGFRSIKLLLRSRKKIVLGVQNQTKMFPLLNNRSLPHVERQILSYLGHMDLVRAAFVCKRWYQTIENKEGRNTVLWAVING